MEWVVRLAAAWVTGALNTTGPTPRLDFAELLAGSRASTPATVSFTWVPESFLQSRNCAPGATFRHGSLATR
jgi:hypothetical protein